MGKIFTFIIFFMSIAFLAVAIMVGASHREWKSVASENKVAADRAERLYDEAKKSSGEKDKLLVAEKVSRAGQIAQLESQLAVFRKRLTDSQRLLATAQIESTSYRERMEEAEKRLSQRDSEVARLLDENNGLVNDITSQRVAVVNLTNKLNDTDARRQQTELLLQDVQGELANRVKVMKRIGVDEFELTNHIAPEVDGAVLKAEGAIVVISIGTDDGLRVGHTVDIYRGTRFVGKATVSKADYNMSAAIIQPEYENAMVQEGDNVTTRF